MTDSRPDPSDLRIERLSGFDTGPADWERLAERADNIFASREWLSTWWRHFGRGELLLLGCRRPDGALAAIIPLYRSRVGPTRVLRFIGHGPGDQQGPICERAECPAVARALRAGLDRGVCGPWDVLLGEQLLREEAWSTLLAGTVAAREANPVLRGQGRSFDQVLASRSRNLRQQVRRRERKLVREHGLRYRLTDDPAKLQDDLSVLFDLHAARWHEGGSDAFSPERQKFHREFAQLALEAGWLRLWVAEVEGVPIAALYGFRFAGSELYYQSGRDPAWDGFAVGFVLLAQAVRTALEEGCLEYRFLRGDEPYKRRFADHDPGLETVVVGRGRIIRAALPLVAGLSGRERPRRWLRRLVG